MGITLIQKSNPQERKENPKLALVLAGGAVSGGAFKVGGLKALNDTLVNRKVTDFDLYVGLSAGAFLAAPLAGGISPEEMLASLDGKSKQFSQLSPFALYKPNIGEFVSRPLKYLYGHLTYVPGILYDLLSAFPKMKGDLFRNLKGLLRHPSYSNYEQFVSPLLRVMYGARTTPQIGEILPSGIFDNSLLESYLRENMKQNRMTNNFKVLKKMSGKSLYITAMNLDSAERVTFGPDEKNDVSISQAIQASTAIPGFYRPARLKGVDYIDGGVKRTANIDVAVEKGADLIICYNPFRPFHNKVVIEYLREENRYVSRSKRVSDMGLGMVFNQVFRTLFHTRLMYAIQTYREDPKFTKDIILIEPEEDNFDFFELNPLYFWNRAKAASFGYKSVARSLDAHFERVSAMLKLYGIETTRDVIRMDTTRIDKSQFDYKVIMDVLEQPQGKRRLKVVAGGK